MMHVMSLSAARAHHFPLLCFLLNAFTLSAADFRASVVP